MGYADFSIKSILFPLLGTGEGGASLEQTVKKLIQAAIVNLEQYPKTTVEKVYFLAWRDAELKSCLTFLDNASDVEGAGTDQEA